MVLLGWVGVDLFFVLSGYLIGDKILSAYSQQKDFSLKNFYARRLLRTLPNYYAVFALYLLIPLALSGTYTAPIWQFLTFTQNLDMRPGETFTHSWSLCVEEQFYLLFPLLCLLTLPKSGAGVSRLWIILGIGFLTAALLRAYMFFTHSGNVITAMDYWEFIYYPSYSRFDELLPGIAIAIIKNYHPNTFERLKEYGNSLFWLGIVTCGLVFYVFLNIHNQEGKGINLWTTSLGYTSLSISFAFLLMAALSPCYWLHRCKIPGATELALWSYAIYLIHKPLYQLLKEPLTNGGVNTNGYSSMGMIVLVSLICGWLLFRLVETPFMSLREKLFPSNNKMGNQQLATNNS